MGHLGKVDIQWIKGASFFENVIVQKLTVIFTIFKDNASLVIIEIFIAR